MLGYILLFIGLILVSESNKRNRLGMAVGFFIVLFIFSSVRYAMSHDYFMYVEFITKGYNHAELIPALLEDLARFLGNPQCFFAISSFYICFFVVRSVYIASSDFSLSIFLYVGLPMFFLSDLSTVRQAMATSTLLLLIARYAQSNFCRESFLKKKLIIMAFVVLAYCCHGAAVVGVLYLLPVEKFSKKIMFSLLLLFSLFGVLIAPVLLNIVVDSVGGHLGLKMEQYMTESMSGQTLLRILFYMITIALLLKYDELVAVNRKNKYFINLMCIGCSFNGLFWMNPHMGTRLCLFLWGAAIFIIPDYIKLLHLNRRLCKIVCIFMFTFYLYNTHKNAVAQKSDNIFIPYTTVFSDKVCF